VLFLAVEHHLGRRPAPTGAHDAPLGWPVAVAMGLGQLLAAVFPGASRSGSTILLALLLGASRPQAAEFSFLLGIPTLLAAGAVQILEAVKAGDGPLPWLSIGVAAGAAAVTAFVVVRWLLGYVQHHSFKIFGWYRIVLGAAILWLG
jgi:undecaprenyl-diphosphatase